MVPMEFSFPKAQSSWKRTGRRGVGVSSAAMSAKRLRGHTSISQSKIHSTKAFHVLAGLSSQLEILFEKATLVSLPLTWTSAAHCSSALREEMPKAVRTHLPSSPQASAYDHNFDKVFYGEVRPAVVRSGTSWATAALMQNVFCCAPSGAMADVWIGLDPWTRTTRLQWRAR